MDFLLVTLRQCLHEAVVPMCCHTGHDTPSRHSIQQQDQPVIVLSIDMEHHYYWKLHNCSILCLGPDPIVKSFPDLPLTPANTQLYDAVLVVVSQKIGRKCIVPTKYHICGVQITYAICSTTATSYE